MLVAASIRLPLIEYFGVAVEKLTEYKGISVPLRTTILYQTS
jgi:hypothetical protein